MLRERPVLDFLATLAERGTTDVEYLRRPEDLATWAVEARIVTEPPDVTDAQLQHAVALREAMYRLVSALVGGAPASAEDLERVNRAARRPLPVRQLAGSGAVSSIGTVDAVLAALAADCIDLHAGPDRTLLRRCDDPRCTRLYLDRSHGRRRRWCDMKGCGDRAKAAAYRRRADARRGPREASERSGELRGVVQLTGRSSASTIR